MHAGTLRGLFVMGENPVLSDPDQQHVVELLKGLDFLVVQDIFLSETAALADVVLPAASFAEKDGTFTNTERKVQRVRAAVPSPGEARADWAIIAELARRLGGAGGWDYAHPADIMAEIRALTPSYAGITYCLLYTSDAADDLLCVDLGGRRIIKKKKKHKNKTQTQ